MNQNIFLLGLFFPLLCNCSAPAEQTDTTNGGIFLTDSLKQVVTIDTVSIQEVTMELTLNGRVTFNQEQVARVYPIFGGTVTEVHAETGDYVQKGEVLAVIRSGEVADYEKQQKDAAQQVLTARRAMDATQDMYVSGIASERDMLQAKQELAAAEAEDKRVKEVFSIYHLLGNSFYQVKSPVAGFIVNKNISKDMQIRSDQSEELFTVSGLENVWVMADVYESDISKVCAGDRVEITTLAYRNRSFGGTIDKVYQVLNDESKTMSVRIKLQNKAYLLKPGMFTNVKVTCKASEERMARIDPHSLVFENGKNYVVAVDGDGSLQVKEVEIYKRSDKECYLRSGVTGGDKILNKNVLLVYNALNDDSK